MTGPDARVQTQQLNTMPSLRGIPMGSWSSYQSAVYVVASCTSRQKDRESVFQGAWSKYCRASPEILNFEEALDLQARVTSWSIKVLTLT